MSLARLLELEQNDHFWVEGRRLLLKEHIERAAPVNLLDIGCGSGALLEKLPPAISVTGVDIDAAAIALCRHRLPEAEFIAADAAELPFADATFDMVLALDILEHHPSKTGPLMEAARVLKPGGNLIVSVPAWRRLYGRHDRAAGHYRRYNRAELLAALAAAGFQIKESGYFNFFLFPLLLLSRGLGIDGTMPSPPVNRLFKRVLAAEVRLSHRISLPWGSSLIAIGEKKNV